nr:xylulose kinase-1 [Tanacetum cinerariifolium]
MATQASKVAGEAFDPLDVDSDPDIHEFPSAKVVKDSADCHWVVSHVTPPSWKKHLQDALKPDRVSIVSKVVLNAATKLIHSDEMGMLVSKLVKASIIYGRYVAFKEVAKLKEPFVIEKMVGYRPSSKQEYDQAGDDLENASYPFLSKYVNDPYASLEQLLSKKPESLCSNPSYNWNSKKSIGRDSKGEIIILPPVSFEEHVAVQRETKARTLLLQFLPEDHMADFHHLDDAREIWLAVKVRFGGNEESKKMRKTMHEAKNKTKEGEQVYGLMAGIKSNFADHAGNAASSVYDAAAKFSMMGISPK